MATYVRLRDILFCGLSAIALLLACSSISRAQSDNLPIYTSPIDVTGMPLQFTAAVHQRDSQRLVDVVLPVDLLPPKVSELFDAAEYHGGSGLERDSQPEDRYAVPANALRWSGRYKADGR